MEVIEVATIRKRGKTYSVIFQNGEGENRKQEWESGYTYTDAKARKAQIEHEESRGIKKHTLNQSHCSSKQTKTTGTSIKNQVIVNSAGDNDGSLMLEPFMEEFIEIYGRKNWGTSYFNSARNLLNNYVYAYWKSTPITDFTVRNIDEYYNWLITECKTVDNKYRPRKNAQHVSRSVVNDIHKILRCAFNQAKKWQYIGSNPFLDAEVPKYKSKVRPALTPTQLEEVIRYTDRPDNYDLYMIHCAINLAFAGSMRGGEIGGLQWEDIVDPERRILYIHKAIDRVDRKALENVSKTEIYFRFPSYQPRGKSIVVLKNTKEDGGSDRNCYLPEAVYDKLMVLKQMQLEIKNEFGDDCYSDYGMMICQENGRPLMTEHLNRKFQSVLGEMGIRPKQGEDQYVFHSIRSTATTYKLRISGGDIKAVQGENGQKDPKIVTHQYSRILDEDRIRIAETVNDDFYRKDKRKKEEDNIMETVKANPDLFKQFMAFMSATDFAKK